MTTEHRSSTGILPVSSRAILALQSTHRTTGKMPVVRMGRMPMLRFSHAI